MRFTFKGRVMNLKKRFFVVILVDQASQVDV